MIQRLAIVLGSLSPAAGGLFHSVRLPANKLAADGVHVDVLGCRDRQFDAARSAWQGPHLHVFDTKGPAAIGFAPGLATALHAAKPDLVHQHGIWMQFSSAVGGWRRATGRPTVISPRGMLDPWATKTSVWKKRLASFAYEGANLRSASALHALNMEEQQAIRAYGLKNPIALIPNGVDMPDLDTTAPAPACFAGEPRRALLFMSRLHPKKGILELLDAWQLLVRDHPAIRRDWWLAIAGWDDGGHESALKAKIEALGLGADVRLIGGLHGREKDAALRHAGAFVLPSYSEGMPMAVLEAWSYGRAVFMTDACNLPGGFDAGAAIRITTEPSALARTLADGLSETATLADMGQRGRTLVARHYTWDIVVSQTRALYDWLLDGTVRPDFVS